MAAFHLTEGNYDKDFPTAVDEFPTVEDLQHYIDAWELNSLFSSIKIVQQYLITHKDAIESTVLDSFSGADGVKEIPVPAGRYPAGKTCTAGDADLVAANIKKDTTIFGVTGSLDVTEKDSFSGADGLKVIPIPAGTYPAAKTCTAVDSDLLAANIKDGVTIFGVEGSLVSGGVAKAYFYVAEHDDDRCLVSGGFSDVSSYLSIGKDSGGSERAFAAIFDRVTIPQGATIITAVLKCYNKTLTSNTVCNAKIHCDNVDNGTMPVDATAFLALSLTTGVDWHAIPAWAATAWYDSPDLKTEIQTIIDRVGWVIENSITVVGRDDGSDTDARRNPRAYNESYGQFAARLYIEWTT